MAKNKDKEEKLNLEERLEFLNFEVLGLRRLFVMYILRQECSDFDADSKEYDTGATYCGPCFVQDYCQQFQNYWARKNSN